MFRSEQEVGGDLSVRKELSTGMSFKCEVNKSPDVITKDLRRRNCADLLITQICTIFVIPTGGQSVAEVNPGERG